MIDYCYEFGRAIAQFTREDFDMQDFCQRYGPLIRIARGSNGMERAMIGAFEEYQRLVRLHSDFRREELNRDSDHDTLVMAVGLSGSPHQGRTSSVSEVHDACLSDEEILEHMQREEEDDKDNFVPSPMFTKHELKVLLSHRILDIYGPHQYPDLLDPLKTEIMWQEGDKRSHVMTGRDAIYLRLKKE